MLGTRLPEGTTNFLETGLPKTVGPHNNCPGGIAVNQHVETRGGGKLVVVANCSKYNGNITTAPGQNTWNREVTL